MPFMCFALHTCYPLSIVEANCTSKRNNAWVSHRSVTCCFQDNCINTKDGICGCVSCRVWHGTEFAAEQTWLIRDSGPKCIPLERIDFLVCWVGYSVDVLRRNPSRENFR